MNKFKSLLLLLVALLVLPAMAQQLPQLPMDKAVRYGKLPNGLTYYIRHNALPENRANFYIAQKVGSVQEEDNQRGLAHFLEHMCFNGTDNFPDDRLLKYCEGIGVKFGLNLNAYTSTDETVYNIDDVPVTENNVDSCLLILRDWADGLTLATKEIDKERGVIHEEWRMRSSASSRIFERNLPALYPGSRYGYRYPIGTMEVIDNFKPEELRAYYEKWYRPDLQGVIVVGDIDVEKVEAKIKALFSPIVMPENAAAYEHYPVPATSEPIYIIDKDKEQARAIIQVMFKHDPLPEELKNTPMFLAANYMNSVAASILNARLGEISQKPECPFIGAGGQDDNYMISKTMDAFTVGILPKPGKDAEALQAVMEEIERINRFGFTATEIIRAREEFLSGMERIYDNREKQKNSFYVPQYVRHFLEGDPIPDIETEYNTYKMLAPNIPAEAISAVFKEYTASTDTNFVCLAMYPEKEDVAVPTVEQFKNAVAAAKAAQLEAYVDNVKDEPLVPQLPKAVKIKKENAADFGYTCWTLGNGARVFFKKTDYNDAEILFSATSFGGQSLIPAKEHINASLLENVIGSTGLGNFTSTELEKKLAGKQASVKVSLGEITDNLSGSSTPKDLRTLFELIYLRFQKPANDVDGYNNTIAYLKTALENADKQPMTAFSDSISATIFGHNPLKKRLHVEDLAQANYETIRQLYSERFQSAGDFDFFFTGAIDIDSLRAFTEQYIAPLPGLKKRESYKDRKLYPVEGSVNNHFKRSMETPQAILIQVWNGDLKYNMKNAVVLNALGEILTQRYLKSIREDAGAAYSVGASGGAEFGVRDMYMLQIYCPFKPALRDSVLLLMQEAIDDIAKNGVTSEELDKVKKFEIKNYADNQRKNSYWQGLISTKVRWSKDEQTGYEDTVNGISSDDIRQFVNGVMLKQKNCITVSMLPTDMSEK
ncbi:putative zinc protease [Bacteroidaceae bacterium]|uniref:M16 family metallopeptidase n=1 Tax=Prevotella sp. MGM2 TaxID=2033406 RepID=UPI000CEA5036|nr:insulinase family protein [Prevotella sp. MGM2]GAY31634.1 zinc protease [Prevotella sp. MGM2]GFI35266.1 putative zinc protease [Bacteroidaceae bacterium]